MSEQVKLRTSLRLKKFYFSSLMDDTCQRQRQQPKLHCYALFCLTIWLMIVWPFTTYKEFFLLHIFCQNVWEKIGLPSSRNQGQDILLTGTLCQGRCERWWNKRRHHDLWGDLFKNQHFHFTSIITLRVAYKVGFLSRVTAGKMKPWLLLYGMTSVKFLARSWLYITDCSVILGGVLISICKILHNLKLLYE